tara:strand:+ start:1169 stop:1471 length:303 start_codon:yes stop_codon:yes gene_type:complete
LVLVECPHTIKLYLDQILYFLQLPLEGVVVDIQELMDPLVLMHLLLQELVVLAVVFIMILVELAEHTEILVDLVVVALHIMHQEAVALGALEVPQIHPLM